MHNEFTAIIEKDGEWYIAYCPEIPGANGQGRTIEECRENLGEAIALILEDRREDVLRGVPADVLQKLKGIKSEKNKLEFFDNVNKKIGDEQTVKFIS